MFFARALYVQDCRVLAYAGLQVLQTLARFVFCFIGFSFSRSASLHRSAALTACCALRDPDYA